MHWRLLYNYVVFFLLTDIDECLQELDDCDNAVTKCINYPGSYICSCYKQNYAWDGATCVGKERNMQMKIVPFLFESFKEVTFWVTSLLERRQMCFCCTTKLPPLKQGLLSDLRQEQPTLGPFRGQFIWRKCYLGGLSQFIASLITFVFLQIFNAGWFLNIMPGNVLFIRLSLNESDMKGIFLTATTNLPAVRQAVSPRVFTTKTSF